ncbi:kell blood group glycoprotein [Megalops cyprinoides]|uniref:kell blood group glycoprotein n=1 Tax=Megalops cyprinoides TaxID=118141 RepID=UPI001863F556|nr:kell blood group glycoprotein [Megalops cyprinoides]
MIDAPPTSQPQSGAVKRSHWDQYRPFLLGLVCSSFLSTLLGLGLYLRHSSSNTLIPPETAQAPLPCLTPACLKAAAQLSAAVDPFAQPCDYFLASCGAGGQTVASRGRQRGKEITQGKREEEEGAGETEGGGKIPNLDRATQTNQDDPRDTSSSLSDRQTALLHIIKEILESEARPGSLNSAEQKVRTFFQSCMNTRRIEQLGSEPVLKLIEKLGGWAVSGKWNHGDFNVTLSLLMKEYSTFPFFSVYVGRDPNDSDSTSHRKYIQIDQPEFQIPVEWDNKEKKSKVTPQTMRHFLSPHLQLLGRLGAPSSSTNLHTGLFLQLSSQLALAASPLSHRLQHQLLYQRMTVRELQAVAPAIDWLRCLRATFHPLPVNQSDVVFLHNLPYIINMSRIISKWQRNQEMSGSGSLHTFMILSLLHKVIPALDSKFTEIQRNLSVALGDTQEVIPRWKKCVLEAEKGFDTVLVPMMRERVGEQEAEELMQNIYSSFKSRLASLRWRDEESHTAVVNKIRTLTPRLLSNREILNRTKAEQQYSEVPVSEDDYFSNYLQFLSLQRRRRNKLFSSTTAPDILSFTPSLSGEEVHFPLGMFVTPFFHPSYPRAVNYGILGTMMAKEILHLLLPDIQSQSETPQTVGECVWAHYLRLTESSHRADPPRLTPAQQQEIWIQYSALQIALQAYNQSLLMYHDDTSLSGLSYTPLFFTSFTQINCSPDPSNDLLPFEPLFLVTVVCMNSDFCPKPTTCSHSTRQDLSQTC